MKFRFSLNLLKAFLRKQQFEYILSLSTITHAMLGIMGHLRVPVTALHTILTELVLSQLSNYRVVERSRVRLATIF